MRIQRTTTIGTTNTVVVVDVSIKELGQINPQVSGASYVLTDHLHALSRLCTVLEELS